MIHVGGRSYSNGIEFSTNKYRAYFETDNNETKIYLRENEKGKTTKVLNFMEKIPFIKGIVKLVRNIDKEYLITMFIVLIVSNNDCKVTEEKHQDNFLTLILLLLLLIVLIKIFKGAKKVLQYHGAEHKVIYTNYEEKDINFENCQSATRISDSCGSMLVILFFFTLTVAYILFAVLGIIDKNFIKLIVSYSTAYELFLLKSDIPIVCLLFKLGYWFQEHVITREPNDEQLKQAIETFKLLEQAETGQIPEDEINKLLKGERTIYI